MKTIILYCNRNVGMISLAFIKGLGHKVKVITDGDKDVEWLAKILNAPKIQIHHLPYHPYDLFLCVHGRKIIPKEYLRGKMVNIHPCLSKYKGQNPIKRYIENMDKVGSIESHWMVEEVDAGEVIHQEFFFTPICKTYADFYNTAMPYYFKTIKETIDKVL